MSPAPAPTGSGLACLCRPRPPPSSLFPYTTLFRSHRRQHRQVRVERADADLEPHLIVALTGAAVRDPGGAERVRSFDEMLIDDRPRQCRDEAAHTFGATRDRKSTRLNSSHLGISYA